MPACDCTPVQLLACQCNGPATVPLAPCNQVPIVLKLIILIPLIINEISSSFTSEDLLSMSYLLICTDHIVCFFPAYINFISENVELL